MFYELAKIIGLSLMTLTGTTTEKKSTNPDFESFIGMWEWVSTSTAGRGGIHVATAEITGTTKTITISEDGKISIHENSKLVCEGGFELLTTKSNDPLVNNFKSDCMKGSLSFKDGNLQQYEYLGCPSRTTLYKRIK